MKNKLANRLKTDTCGSMLSSLNLLEEDLKDWTPSTKLLQKYNQYTLLKTYKSNEILHIQMYKKAPVQNKIHTVMDIN